MIERLSKILRRLNIGLQTARSILGRNLTLNSKITDSQFRILENYVRNLTSKYKAVADKSKSIPVNSLQGVPEEIYAESAQEKSSTRKKKKQKNSIPTASSAKKGRAKYSDSYSLQLLKNRLAKKFEGYIYGLSDW